MNVDLFLALGDPFPPFSHPSPFRSSAYLTPFPPYRDELSSLNAGWPRASPGPPSAITHMYTATVCVSGPCGCVLIVYFVRSPSRAPYRTPSVCAIRATYSDTPPVVPEPESITAQAAYTEALLPGSEPSLVLVHV